MSTDAATAAHILDTVSGAGHVAIRRMFGEYALYCDGKVVALVCDNEMFVKPIPEARTLLPGAVEAPPYPGARPHLLVGDALDDPDLMSRLVRAVADALPAPKPKKPKKRGRT